MAVSVSEVHRSVLGCLVTVAANVTFDSSYPTGGELLPAAKLGLLDPAGLVAFDAGPVGSVDALTTNLTGANNDLVFTAVAAGDTGITVALVDPQDVDQALSVSVTGSDISVSLATGPGGAITSTASQVLAAVNADGDASALVVVSLKAGNTGAGVVTALAETPLTGGFVLTFPYDFTAGKVKAFQTTSEVANTTDLSGVSTRVVAQASF